MDDGKVLVSMCEHAQLLSLDVKSETGSTKVDALDLARDALPIPVAVLAEFQSSGRGRRGRVWHAPFASGLALSFACEFPGGASRLEGLSLAVGVCLAELLRRRGVQNVALKWPNDIYWKNKKLAGILLEMRGELSGPSAVVIGVGLNISMPSSSIDVKKIDQPWIDLETILGKKVNRNEFTAFVIDALFDVLNEIPDKQNTLLEEWQQTDVLKDQNVEVVFADKTICGTAIGINREGAIRLLHEVKEIVCHAVEVTISGGY